MLGPAASGPLFFIANLTLSFFLQFFGEEHLSHRITLRYPPSISTPPNVLTRDVTIIMSFTPAGRLPRRAASRPVDSQAPTNEDNTSVAVRPDLFYDRPRQPYVILSGTASDPQPGTSSEPSSRCQTHMAGMQECLKESSIKASSTENTFDPGIKSVDSLFGDISSVEEPSSSKSASELIPEAFNDPPAAVRKLKALDQLPPELLRSITDLLPDSSAAALTLCNREISLKLGTSFFERLNRDFNVSLVEEAHGSDVGWLQLQLNPPTEPHLGERDHFLLLLEKDLPDEIYCYYCKKLHSPEKTGSEANQYPHVPRAKRRPCTNEEYSMGNYFVGEVWDFGFSFSHLQMIMNRYCRGLDYSSHIKRLSKTLTLNWNRYVDQQSTNARIISGELYLRTQRSILLPPELIVQLPSCHQIGVCPHMVNLYPNLEALKRGKLAFCKASHGDSNQFCPTCSGITQCKECATDLKIEAKYLGVTAFAIDITVWQCFGECIQPLDPMWQSHFYSYRPWRRRDWAPQLASIKEVFESLEN